MRKSLSILLVISLVLSLFAGVAAPRASAATAGLDKSLASYKYIQPYIGPTTLTPVAGSGTWTIGSAAAKLSTYTMGDYIDGTALVSIGGVPTGNGIVELRDVAGNVIETTNYTAGRFRLATAGVRWDGVYQIFAGVDHAGATLLQTVLIKYIWQLDQNAMNFCKTNYISGFVRRGDGTGASGARVAVIFPDLNYVISGTVNNYGQFGMTIGPDHLDEYQRGLYTVAVIDNYPTTAIAAGTYYTTGPLAVVAFAPVNGITINQAQTSVGDATNNVDSIVYAQLSTTTLNWKLDTYLSCTILYENAVGVQPFVLSLFDDAGNPVPSTTPTLAWTYTGFTPSAPPVEISRGYYQFVGTPTAGAAYVQVTATATVGGVAISATKNIAVTAQTEWNPQVLVTTNESILQGDGYTWMGKTVYDKLPCTIGNSLNVFTVVYAPKNTPSAAYEHHYTKVTVSDSTILDKVSTLSTLPWTNTNIVYSTGAKYFITKGGKIAVHIDAEVWQMADMSCKTFDEGRNACCLIKTFDCVVCEVPTCTVDKVEQVKNTDGTYDVKITIGGDPNNILSCEICNKIIVDIVAYDDNDRVVSGFGTNGHVWYNPIAPAENPLHTGIEDLPNYPADPFGTTNVEFTNVGNTLVLKNIDFDGFCTDTFAIWVYGTKKVAGCGTTDWIHPAIYVRDDVIESPYAETTLTATADVTKLVAGVCQKVMLTGLTFTGTPTWTAKTSWGGTVTGYNPVYLGSGQWVLNIDPAFDAAGTVTLTGTYTNSGACTKQTISFTFEVLMPEFTIEIGLKDGTKIPNDHILTEGLEELVYVTAKNPLTGAEIKPTELSAVAVDCSCDIPGSVVDWWHPAGCEGISPIAIVGLDNPNVACDPQVEVYFTACGADILVDTFTFKKPTISVDPNKDIPFYGCATCGDGTNLTFKMIDAHQHGVPDQEIWVSDGYYGGLTATSFGYAYTGTDGLVIFKFFPQYQGHYYVTLASGGSTPMVSNGMSFPTPDVADIVYENFWPSESSCVYSKWIAPLVKETMKTISTVYKAPEKDTTAPVITITAGLNDSTVGASAFMLTGKVSDNRGVEKLTVGYQIIDILPDGSFSANVALVKGLNTIEVKAYDAAGNVGAAAVKVTYAIPVDTTTTIVLTIGADIVSVNGKATSIDAAPEIIEGRTFVPIRFISEAFGSTVEWLPETQGITITLGDMTIGLQIGNATAVIDGTIVSLPAAPYIKNGRTMVPLRVISEAFGGQVAWDPTARTITIVYTP
jgi:hypothetical protein